MYMNPLGGSFTAHQLFLFILLIHHVTLPVMQAMPIDATATVSDNEGETAAKATTTLPPAAAVAAAATTTTTSSEEDFPLPKKESEGLTLAKREEPLGVKNDSNESSKGPVDATGEWMKEVTDQLRSESEEELRKQETHEQPSRGESKDEVKESIVEKESEQGAKEEEEDDSKEATLKDEEKAIAERFWVNQGNPGGFTFKPNSQVHSSILILPLVPPAYQIVTGNANDAASEKDASKNIFLVKANAMNPPILHPPAAQNTPVKGSTPSVHQNHHLHNRVSDLFMNQLVSSPAVVPFDSAIRFSNAHSNSPMVPFLLLDSPEAASILNHPQAQLKQLQFGHQNLQFGSFAPVNLPTRWWLSPPQLTPADTSSVKSDRGQEEPSKSQEGEEEEKQTESPVSTEETNAASTETTSDFVSDSKEEASDAVTTPAVEEENPASPEKKDEGQVDGDKSDSGERRRKKRQADSVVTETGEKSSSTIDDVVKSIVASNSKNNAQTSQGKQASAPSPPLEGILKNGQAKNPLEMGLEIASGILTSIRTATSDAGVGGEGRFSSSTLNREMSLSSLLAKSPSPTSNEKINNNNTKDSGLFHVFRGVFGSI